MSAHASPSPARFALRAPRLDKVIAFTAALVGLFTSPGRCTPTAADSGRWTPPNALTGTAVHMALLRGHGPYHSDVMWWYGKGRHAEFYGGLLGWKPGDYNCGSFPDTSILAPYALPLPDSAGVFCSSNSIMADGRLFLAGGTQPYTEYGVRHAYTFDASSTSWTKVDSMSDFRFYPSSTTLSDGRQLVLSGSQDHFLYFFGGLVNADAAPLDSAVFRYGDGYNGRALSPVRTSSTPVWPSPREGHAAVLGGFTLHMFGGRDRSGHYLNDYWQLVPGDNTFGADFDYAWKPTSVPGPPPQRWDHSAVTTPSALAWMIVFGGIAKSTEDTTLDIVTNDVWRLWWNTNPPAGLKWSEVTVLSPNGSPGARCGHLAAWRASDRRMLMFGGRGSTGGSPTDSALWSLNFSSDYSSALPTALTSSAARSREDRRSTISGGLTWALSAGTRSPTCWAIRLRPAAGTAPRSMAPTGISMSLAAARATARCISPT